MPDRVRRLVWRTLALLGLARLRGASPQRGVHFAAWKGPAGEDVLIPVDATGRIVTATPIYVRNPAEFSDAMVRCWHLLEDADPTARAAFARELVEEQTASAARLLAETIDALAASRPEQPTARELRFPARA